MTLTNWQQIATATEVTGRQLATWCNDRKINASPFGNNMQKHADKCTINNNHHFNLNLTAFCIFSNVIAFAFTYFITTIQVLPFGSLLCISFFLELYAHRRDYFAIIVTEATCVHCLQRSSSNIMNVIKLQQQQFYMIRPRTSNTSAEYNNFKHQPTLPKQ